MIVPPPTGTSSLCTKRIQIRGKALVGAAVAKHRAVDGANGRETALGLRERQVGRLSGTRAD